MHEGGSIPKVPTEKETASQLGPQSIENIVKSPSALVHSEEESVHFSKWELSWSSDIADHNGKGEAKCRLARSIWFVHANTKFYE